MILNRQQSINHGHIWTRDCWKIPSFKTNASGWLKVELVSSFTGLRKKWRAVIIGLWVWIWEEKCWLNSYLTDLVFYFTQKLEILSTPHKHKYLRTQTNINDNASKENLLIFLHWKCVFERSTPLRNTKGTFIRTPGREIQENMCYTKPM